MESSVVVPLVGVVLGALLAALGSLVVQRAASSRERRDVLRRKLEEQYLLVGRLTKWADQQVDLAAVTALGMTSPSSTIEALESSRSRQVARPTDEMMMLARFYHPRLERDAAALDKLADDVAAALNDVLTQLAERSYADDVPPGLLDATIGARDALAARVAMFRQTVVDSARELT